MHDVQTQIRCQRCGHQMELMDPGPDDPWPPQQFWECQQCGRHFWTTYPPPKAPVPTKASKPVAPESDAATQPEKRMTSEAKLEASAAPQRTSTSAEPPSEERTGPTVEKQE